MTAEQLQQALTQVSTPAYVFDIGALKRRVDYLRSMLPRDVVLCYAMKANSFIVRELQDWVDRFEVCSPGEYHICQALEIPGSQLVISGVYKHPRDVEEMVAGNPDIYRYTAESQQQFELLHDAAARQRRRLPVLLRLTSGNQFGMDEAVLREIIRRRDEYPWLEIRGIQYFSGTQKHSLKKLTRETERLSGLLDALKEDYGYQAPEVEYGPGFPVFYFQSDSFDEDRFLQEFGLLLEPLLQKARVTLELGRSIAASCGTYLTSVVDQKVNKKENYAILDGGIHQLVYYGQTMAMKFPFYQVLPPRSDEQETKLWNLCGSLCTANDIILKQLPVAGLKIGDVFAFERTGGYSVTEGISLFLSRALPAVVLLTEDGRFVPVREHLPTDPLNTPNYK